jgi:hypothetical protein
MSVEKINWPQGLADEQSLSFATTIAATITNMLTILTLAQLTADATLDLTIDSQVREGAIVHLVVPALTNGFDLTLGAGIDGPAIVGVATKTKTQSFFYDGTSFKPFGTAVQIN